MGSGLRVAKFVVAILAMLAIAGCAERGDRTASSNAAVSGSQWEFGVNTLDRVFLDKETWVVTGQARALLDNCSDPCTIQRNYGGVITEFENAGDAIRAGTRQSLVIDGFCTSACMVMADRARPRACITPRAQFGYHQTDYNRPIPLNADLHSWIMSHGGYPSYAAMGIMPNDAAREFWPLCSQDQTATSADTH